MATTMPATFASRCSLRDSAHPHNQAFASPPMKRERWSLAGRNRKESAMTIVSLNTESASLHELSPDQLDQVTGGDAHDGNNAVPAIMLLAAAIATIGGAI